MSDQLAERVAHLEAEVAQLKVALKKSSNTEASTTPESSTTLPWWEERIGAFADEPMYDEAMQLGREYRESLRPDPEETEKAAVASSPATVAPPISISSVSTSSQSKS